MVKTTFLTYCGIYYCLSVLYVSLRLCIARRKMIFKHSIALFYVVTILVCMLFLDITNLFSKK